MKFTAEQPHGVHPEEWHPAETIKPEVIKEYYDRARDHSEVPKAWHLLDMALASHDQDIFTDAFNAFAQSCSSIEAYYDNLDRSERRRKTLARNFDYLSCRLARAYRPAFWARMEEREITVHEMLRVHKGSMRISSLALNHCKVKGPDLHQFKKARHMLGSEIITRTGYPGFFPHLASCRENKGGYESFIKNLDDERTLRMHFTPDVHSAAEGILSIPIGLIAFEAWSEQQHVDSELEALKLTQATLKHETPGRRSPILDQMSDTCLNLINDSWESLLQ